MEGRFILMFQGNSQEQIMPQICCNLGQDYWVLMLQHLNRGLKAFGERREHKLPDISLKQIQELQGSSPSRLELWALEAKLSEIKEEGRITIKIDAGDLGRTTTVDRLASSHERIISNSLTKAKHLSEKIYICFMLMLLPIFAPYSISADPLVFYYCIYFFY